jgi:hypothetical protein
MFLARLLVGVLVTAPIAMGWGPPPAGAAIWITREEVRALPMSGPAWTALKSKADSPAGTPNLSNQDDNCDVIVLAKALAHVRTGIETYRTQVRLSCMAAIDTEVGGESLALARNLVAYVVAAELVGLEAAEDEAFRAWLRRALAETLTDGRTLRSNHETRPNNYGTHAGASRAAAAVYLGDTAEVARVAKVFRGWLGDRTSYAGFKYGDLAWQCDPAAPVGINPAGCVRKDIPLDGALPEEMRRGGSLQWPPLQGDAVNYTWEAVQGALVQAEILARQGYDTWSWEDRALRRMMQFLYDLDLRFGGWWAAGDDAWSPWIANRAYRVKFPATTPTRPGKNMGYTDWTHVSSGTPPSDDTSAPGSVRDMSHR